MCVDVTYKYGGTGLGLMLVAHRLMGVVATCMQGRQYAHRLLICLHKIKESGKPTCSSDINGGMTPMKDCCAVDYDQR